MFVRVLDKEQNVYYKSMVYAALMIDCDLQYIVLNPYTRNFQLVDCLDEHFEPAKPLVEVIQPVQEEFVVYKGAQMLKYKHYCKINGCKFVDVKQMMGYPEVLENNAFLANILANHSVPFDAYHIQEKELCDTMEWNYILTQEDADDFMKKFVGFHDSTLEKIDYYESYSSAVANAVFDNSGWYGTVELCFEGVQMLKINQTSRNFSGEIFEASLIVENESVFWADSYMEKPNDLYGGSIIRALNLKWRKL